MPLRRRTGRMARLMRRLRRYGAGQLPVPLDGGQVVLLPDGPAFFASFFCAIEQAQTLICLEYYRIRADQTGQQLADALIAAARRGVTIYLIYDAIGCHVTGAAYFEQLRSVGIACLPFNPLSFRRGIGWFDRRDHRKLAIFDNRVAYLGGINISDAYAGLTDEPMRFRDVGFRLGGAAVTALLELFATTWYMESGESLRLPELPGTGTALGEAEVTLIDGGPHQRRSAIRTAFRVAMASASRELLIANPYFVPGPGIVRSLLRAAKRGVRVRLLLPARSDVPLVRLVSRSTYEPLLRAGIEIYEMERQLLHAKLMLIDGERTVLGSANLDQRSFHRNFEINAVVRGRAFGQQVRLLFQQDFAESRVVTLGEHARRGMVARMLEWLLKPISWFL